MFNENQDLLPETKAKLKDLSPYNYNDIRPDILEKIIKKINTPEEKVRYWWIQKLIHEYNLTMSHLTNFIYPILLL